MVGTLLMNLLRLVVVILVLPFRLLRKKRKPRFVRFLLRDNPPYLEKALRRRLLRRRADPSEVTSLEEFGRKLRLLMRDPAVRGVLIVVEDLHFSHAKRQAVADLLAEFRRAGKQVVAYANQASNVEYELLCSAERILLAPGGRLELTGFATEATALGSGLKRLGIAAHFIRRGEYKTAPELFTESTVSPTQRNTLERILDEQYQALLKSISIGRKLEEAQVRTKIDAGPYTARRACSEKLCDALCPEPDLVNYLAAGAPPSPNRIPEGEDFVGPFATYARSLLLPAQVLKPLKRAPNVAVVPLSGLIADADLGLPSPFPMVAGADRVIEGLRAASRDLRADALVLLVDSPGGSAVASERILEEVKAANRKKPVVAYFDRLAASGGYLAALGAKEMWAAPKAIVGSIGVFAGKFECSKLLEHFHIDRQILTRGENAGLFSISRGFTENERRALEAEVEDTYQSFLEHVASARGMSKQEVHARAEGRIYSGADALEAGLIHGIGGFDRACRRALQLAGKDDARYDTILHTGKPRASSPLALLRRLSSANLFALWDPWLCFPALGDAERFG